MKKKTKPQYNTNRKLSDEDLSKLDEMIDRPERFDFNNSETLDLIDALI